MIRIIGFIACGFLISGGNDIFAGVVDESTSFRGSSVQIATRCHSADSRMSCGVFASRKDVEKRLFNFPNPPSHISMVSGVFIIEFPCGTQCSATYFYSEQKGLGGPFPFVEAYDLDRGVVLLSEKNPLPMYPIFSKASRIVGEAEVDLANGADTFASIKKVVVDGHKFVITYVDRRGEVVTIRYQVPLSKGVPAH
ncbi:hypothetical protein [Burkholderia sp. IMCC1007]|uniref:hypothetical protein n=1 Tax=Burkholderia sp. IMCC1007 TaxID=3004104 RepID=UPI0022B2B15F|nr:hypothetical protein [Burkholderia sp. IMCC1007]